MSIPDLVISDGHTNIRDAVLKYSPESAWQYCHVHLMQNMIKHIPRKHWTGIGIVKEALENPDLLPIAQEYLMRNNMEKAADTLTGGIDPYSHRSPNMLCWRRLRTTNVLERMNLEIKRITRKIGTFPSEQ